MEPKEEKMAEKVAYLALKMVPKAKPGEQLYPNGRQIAVVRMVEMTKLSRKRYYCPS